MDVYIYGERRPLPEGFAAYHDRWRSAVVSIDSPAAGFRKVPREQRPLDFL
jgi:hypothetical protein